MQQILCIKDVFMDEEEYADAKGPKVFTKDNKYDITYNNRYINTINDNGGRHSLGPANDEWFIEHFKLINVEEEKMVTISESEYESLKEDA